MATTELEIPTVLPVENLSNHSINTYIKCPERWRRRYIEREYEPSSPPLLLGKAFGAAEHQSFHEQIAKGEALPTDDVLDLFSDEWDSGIEEEEIDWQDKKPDEVKDSGIATVKVFEQKVRPNIHPVESEREITATLPGVEWGFTGFLDVEEEDDVIGDLKMKGKKLSRADADVDLQPTSYLLLRKAEGRPAKGFRFHTAITYKDPRAERVWTNRTDAQLDAFVDRVYSIAAEINWRLEHQDVWQGAVPGAWWCSEKFCGYWNTCPMGGAR